MDQTNSFLSPVTRFLSWIDEGSFFKQPLKWLFYLFGVVSAFACLYAIFYFYDDGEFGRVIEHTRGWDKFVGILLFIVFGAAMVVMAIYSAYYWIRRSVRLGEIVKTGDKITAIPTMGYIFQTLLEVVGLQVIVLGIFMPTMLLLLGVLRWEFHQYDGFWMAIVMWVGACLGACLVGYLLVLAGHFVGEKCRVWAIVGNNLEEIRHELEGPERHEEPVAETEADAEEPVEE